MVLDRLPYRDHIFPDQGPIGAPPKFLHGKRNRSTKKASKCYRSVGMNVSLLKETMLMNEVEFFLKIVVLLVILRTC